MYEKKYSAQYLLPRMFKYDVWKMEGHQRVRLLLMMWTVHQWKHQNARYLPNHLYPHWQLNLLKFPDTHSIVSILCIEMSVQTWTLSHFEDTILWFLKIFASKWKAALLCFLFHWIMFLFSNPLILSFFNIINTVIMLTKVKHCLTECIVNRFLKYFIVSFINNTINFYIWYENIVISI